MRSPSRGIAPAEAARQAGVSWPVGHEAFAAAADPVLDQPVVPVALLGIDEHRRVRIACTRGYRRRSRTATLKRTQPVTGRQPDPG